jgi:rhamnogalacturonyl hydrolase YesR
MLTRKLINHSTKICLLIALVFAGACSSNQPDEEQKMSDSLIKLHALQPDYKIPYVVPKITDIEKTLSRVHQYLDANTFMKLIHNKTNEEVSDYSKIDKNTILAPGDFRIVSYEWGVAYAGMLLCGNVTGNNKFTEYTYNRLKYIHKIFPHFKSLTEDSEDPWNALTSVTKPHTLDDAGSMCAAMIKAKQNGLDTDLDTIIKNYINHISNKQFRLTDGTFARKAPYPNTLWLDDLFMSVPALARMGSYTGDNKYFDDAVKQVLQFSERMFNKEKGIYMHGWVQDMEDHPEFHWGRANGWAIMAKVELLDVLPKDHPGYEKVLALIKAHIKGLAQLQSGDGFWHQLLDREDSYLETSATAIYTYSIAKAINNGWIDKKSYGSRAILAWNAINTKVNEKGQVEGTCVGTGMAFDPSFYYYRPVNVYAAHGYGPVLLAGAEIINLIKNSELKIGDSALLISD